MADGRHFEHVFPYISAVNHPMLMKFGTEVQILNSTMLTWNVLKKLALLHEFDDNVAVVATL